MRILKRLSALLMAVALCFAAASAEEQTAFERYCEEIKLENSDTQAWIEIPGTNISYPVMQHAQDDKYYLDHSCHGKNENYGALYTESQYNQFDFSDPVVVIYGHRMNNGSMLGTMQKYYSSAFDQYRTINVYLPSGEERQYTVFAAVLCSDLHLLHYNNFHSPRVFNRFFDDIFATRKLGITLDHQMRPEPDEQVIVLSTCIKGDASQRYLVMAKLNDENI